MHYHDQWFWVDDRDWRSKRALSTIMFLFTMIEGTADERLPLLTIPSPVNLTNAHSSIEREWAYDSKFSNGCLDEGLDEAPAKGWTVVDMKQEGKVGTAS